MEEEPSYSTYGEAYDINCARFGREPDLPIVTFKRKLAGEDGSYANDPDYMIRLAAYHDITDRLVNENIFSQYMYKTLPTSNHLWVFKKYFCTQMALSGKLSSSRLQDCIASTLWPGELIGHNWSALLGYSHMYMRYC